MLSFVKKIPVYIYDLFISTFLTISSHIIMMNHMTLLSGNFMDVGCGTGAPLKKIAPILKENYEKIVGVDLDPKYTDQAKAIFKDDEKIEIHNLDFYKVK
jgi:SAM-dependent methyltransferase